MIVLFAVKLNGTAVMRTELALENENYLLQFVDWIIILDDCVESMPEGISQRRKSYKF